jgi:hypothetical protein
MGAMLVAIRKKPFSKKRFLLIETNMAHMYSLQSFLLIETNFSPPDDPSHRMRI